MEPMKESINVKLSSPALQRINTLAEQLSSTKMGVIVAALQTFDFLLNEYTSDSEFYIKRPNEDLQPITFFTPDDH